MIFEETDLEGVFVVEPEPIEDERGFFARTFCRKEFEDHGLNFNVVQCNLSHNKIKGTLRGIHYQVAPYQEAKLVFCIKGAIYDVIVDLRTHSPTFKRWTSEELSAENRKIIYIPEGFGHGFMTLEDDTEVFYYMSEIYHPECARGVRWNDPVFGIKWPMNPTVLSEKDREYDKFLA